MALAMWELLCAPCQELVLLAMSRAALGVGMVGERELHGGRYSCVSFKRKVVRIAGGVMCALQPQSRAVWICRRCQVAGDAGLVSAFRQELWNGLTRLDLLYTFSQSCCCSLAT